MSLVCNHTLFLFACGLGGTYGAGFNHGPADVSPELVLPLVTFCCGI